MDAKELKRIFHRGKCLSLETMRMYNEGKLPSKSSHAVEEHLLECSLCASAIDGLNARRITDVTKVSGNINKRLAVYMNTPPTTPILSRFGVAMIVSSFLLALGLTTWLLSGDITAPTKELADSGSTTHYQPPAEPGGSSQDIPENSAERSQNNGAVSVPDGSASPVEPAISERTPEENGGLVPPQKENVPAETQTQPPLTQEPPKSPDENTRVAPTDQFLRIKSVTIYPPTTHTDKKPKSNDGGGNGGQLNRSKESKGDFKLEEMPSYPGGNEALKAYILNNFKPQKEDKENLKRKTTGVMFQVNVKTGEVSGASLSFPIAPLTDAELLRVFNAMPYWNPGTKRGTVDVMVGITFE